VQKGYFVIRTAIADSDHSRVTQGSPPNHAAPHADTQSQREGETGPGFRQRDARMATPFVDRTPPAHP
jgi:hypothetical protein